MPLTKIEAGLIANNAVTSQSIAQGTVIAADILDGTIDNNKLVTANITGDKLVNSTITGDKLSATITSGNVNLGGTTSFLGSVAESANVTTLMGANTTVNIASPYVVFTANSSANSTVNFTGLAGVPVGNSSSFVIVVPNSSTPKWQGGAPTSILPANTDIYSFTIIKTAATPTYNIFASVASYF